MAEEGSAVVAPRGCWTSTLTRAKVVARPPSWRIYARRIGREAAPPSPPRHSPGRPQRLVASVQAQAMAPPTVAGPSSVAVGCMASGASRPSRPLFQLPPGRPRRRGVP
jgi:hypothetical protein